MVRARFRCSWDDIAYLDADHMAGWGAFTPYKNETIDFDDDSLPRLSFEMEGARGFRVTYRWQEYTRGPGDDFVTVRVALDRRPCRFGGSRAYFVCPICQRGTLRLAVLPEGLRCGRCGLVTWGSRREGQLQRLVRKGNKVAQLVGSDCWSDAPNRRPPHMRLTTFIRREADRTAIASKIEQRMRQRLDRSGVFRRIAYLARL